VRGAFLGFDRSHGPTSLWFDRHQEIEMNTQAENPPSVHTFQTTQEKPDVLASIEAYKRREIAVAKEQIAPAAMQKLARQTSRPREFVSAIERHLSEGRPALIAEIKKASPRVEYRVMPIS
jgi:Indole-3-glycerol phosphate synthase